MQKLQSGQKMVSYFACKETSQNQSPKYRLVKNKRFFFERLCCNVAEKRMRRQAMVVDEASVEVVAVLVG